MRYKCLVLDHDDTVVKSTPAIHYPSFTEAMQVLRPDAPRLTLQEFINYSFSPGILHLLTEVMRLDEREMQIEQDIWRKHTRSTVPESYEGFAALLDRYRLAGGRVCVVSHSERENIVRHYEALFGFTPDMVFGWELPEHQRKPEPYPLDEIMRAFSLTNMDLLMVDDLKPGLTMALSRGVDFAWAGWSDTAPYTRDFMLKNAKYPFETVEALERFVFS